MGKHHTYETITAAIRARAWARGFIKRNGRPPNEDEIDRLMKGIVRCDRNYVKDAIRNLDHVPS